MPKLFSLQLRGSNFLSFALRSMVYEFSMRIYWGMSSMCFSVTSIELYWLTTRDFRGFSVIASDSHSSGSTKLNWESPISNWYFYSDKSSLRAFLIRRRDLTISIILISFANCFLAISISCILLVFLQYRQRHSKHEGRASFSHSKKLKSRVGVKAS